MINNKSHGATSGTLVVEQVNDFLKSKIILKYVFVCVWVHACGPGAGLKGGGN